MKDTANEETLPKWYVRYPLAIFAISWAFVCYEVFLNGYGFDDIKGFHGLILYLFLNPVTGVIMLIAAIVHAWEVVLIIIAGFILYYIFLGVATLPLSVAIILGSVVIAYGIFKNKA